eukprot:360061-Chlamydomonas_euryale.AAC.3
METKTRTTRAAAAAAAAPAAAAAAVAAAAGRTAATWREQAGWQRVAADRWSPTSGQMRRRCGNARCHVSGPSQQEIHTCSLGEGGRVGGSGGEWRHRRESLLCPFSIWFICGYF